MIVVLQSDVVPLDQFPLAWRFTDQRWDESRGPLRRDLRPLRAPRAAEIQPRMTAACAAYHHGERVPEIHVPAPCEDAADVERTRRALAALPIEPGARVLVSWDERTALETSWRTFADHWEAFCYPSSDDVTIVPLDERWVLCFHHWEAFSFTGRDDGATPV